MEAKFDRLDVGRKGELAAEELSKSHLVYHARAAAIHGRESLTHARQLLRAMDKHPNGRVSKQEFMRFMEAEFDRLDVGRKGELTARELSKSQFRYQATRPGGTGSR
jgi:hypothetical protein